jgi:hypothetical protein
LIFFDLRRSGCAVARKWAMQGIIKQVPMSRNPISLESVTIDPGLENDMFARNRWTVWGSGVGKESSWTLGKDMGAERGADSDRNVGKMKIILPNAMPRKPSTTSWTSLR